MNQIPNIEETYNTREEIVNEFWKMMEQNQFVKSTNSITDKVEKYPPAIVDMEATVSIHGEFDKHAIDEWLHHQLQKARHDWLREEKERVIDLLIEEGYLRGRELIPHDESKKSHGTCCYCGTCGHDNDYCVCEHNSLLQTIIERYHSELDQGGINS